MPFTDRFIGSNSPTARTELCFRTQVIKASAVKDDWAFVWDDALRSNIAYALQEVHFDILLLNNYNVFWALESMKLKHALVQTASVAEAVLQYMLQMIEDDPRVQEALGAEWKWLDFTDPTQGRIDVPQGQRVVAGVQHKVQIALHRNTKMKTLIEAARRADIIDERMAEALHDLRENRNRVHIKSLTSPEYSDYTPRMANEALDKLEHFRAVALTWVVSKRRQEATRQLESRDLAPVATGAVGSFDTPNDDIPF